MIRDTHTKCRNFLDSNFQKILGYTFGDGERPTLSVAVVSCEPAPHGSCFQTVSSLAHTLTDWGWKTVTKDQWCTDDGMGIMLLVGWSNTSTASLTSAVRSVKVGHISVICVFDVETRELLNSVEVGAGGRVIITEPPDDLVNHGPQVDPDAEYFYVISYEDGTYYKDPDDRMNTSAPLVLARRYTTDELPEATYRASVTEGHLCIWMFKGDTPVALVEQVTGAKITGSYGNRTPSGVLRMDLR